MDLLNILIDPVKIKSTCFMCFKQYDDTVHISQKFVICDEYQTSDVSLSGIMESLFPQHEILFHQACTNCSNFLLKAFTMIRKNCFMKDLLSKITEAISDEILDVKQVVSNSCLYVSLKSTVRQILKQMKTKNECKKLATDIHNEDKPTESIQGMTHSFEKCKKCDMKFVNKQLLNQHEKMTHETRNNGVICEFCGKDCKKPASLKLHLNCHKVKSCPYCHKTLKSHSHFKLHVKNHESCRKRSYRISQYTCNLCPYKSLNKNSLDAHKNKVHLQTRPFICEICNKGFYKKSNLTEHLNTHNNVKNLTCEQCGDSFVTKKTLIEHLRLHSGEKPFQCHICNLSFVTSGRRSDHFKRKHMEKTICCFVCDKKFSLKKELNAHMKKIHSQSIVSDGLLNNVPFDQQYFDGKVVLKSL